MSGKTRVVNLRELRTFGAPLRDAHRVLVLALHADFQSLQSPLEQPAAERIRRLPPDHHLATHFIDEWLVTADDSGEKVVMTVEKLGRRMNHCVGAVLDRAEVDRTRERRIDYERDSLRMSQALQRVELEHAARGVYRGFEEDHTRILFQSLTPGAWLERIDEGDFDSHPG